MAIEDELEDEFESTHPRCEDDMQDSTVWLYLNR